MLRIARPADPGQLIKMEVVESEGFTVTCAAKALSVTRTALSALLNGYVPKAAPPGPHAKLL